MCPPADVFVIFDSHPRPDLHPRGAAFIFNSSVQSTASYLSELLGYDRALLADRNIQWQAQLLGNFSGHIFIARNVPNLQDEPDYWLGATIEASLEGLARTAENAELKLRNTELADENTRLRGVVSRLERDARVQSVWQQAKQSYPTAHPHGSRPQKREGMLTTLLQSGSSAFAAARSYASGSGTAGPSRQITRPSCHVEQKADHSIEKEPANGGDSVDVSNDLAFALQQQQLYDEESHALERERKILSMHYTFKCNICLEDQPQEDVAQVDGCGHLFCRDCIRGYISSQLSDHLYPIMCPLCSTEKSKKQPSGRFSP